MADRESTCRRDRYRTARTTLVDHRTAGCQRQLYRLHILTVEIHFHIQSGNIHLMHLLRNITVQQVFRRHQPRTRIHRQCIPPGIPNVCDHHFTSAEISCGHRPRPHTLTGIVEVIAVEIAEDHTCDERLRVDAAKIRNSHRSVVGRTTFISPISHAHTNLIPARIQHIATVHTAAPKIQMAVVNLLQLIDLLRRSSPRQILTNGSRIPQRTGTLLRSILAARRVMAEIIAAQHVLGMTPG